jgi:hypothetical protein
VFFEDEQQWLIDVVRSLNVAWSKRRGQFLIPNLAAGSIRE